MMKKANTEGFTLIELLVVIVIVGLLTVMVMVNFRSGAHTNDLRRVGTELLQNIRLAQQYTLGGNSVKYCTSDAGNLFGHYCSDYTGCNNIPGACKTGVPLGGYAAVIDNQNSYKIFGDTDFGSTDGSGIYNSPDYLVIDKYISLNGVHIRGFKLNDQSVYQVPTGSNYAVVRFSPPEGTAHFFIKLSAQSVGSEVTAATQTSLDIIVGSDYLPQSCRKITINRISGQISENGGSCP
jgi:prepilin-type N-terminal cleavage/methylation domain-containing protein